jgi:ubiquinone/menaquinone biosynthesis C-methylase UbiE
LALTRFQRFEARFYSAIAPRLYDRIVVSLGFKLLAGRLHEKVLGQGARAVQAAGPKPILDLPVGTAYFTLRWGRGASVVGVDIAGGMVEQARARATTAGVQWLTPVQADVLKLPFGDQSFGAIMCTNGLQVMPPLAVVLAEMGRVLNHAGTLFVCMILFPVGALLPEAARRHLPTLFLSRKQVLATFHDTGWKIAAADRSRLALLLEAKPPTKA